MGIFKNRKKIISPGASSMGEVVYLVQGSIKVGSMLEVLEGQTAFFMVKDKFADTLTKGSYKLTFQNLPEASRLLLKKYERNEYELPKKIKADLYVIDNSDFKISGLSDSFILLNENNKKIKSRVNYDAELKVGDAKKFLRCLRTEISIVRPGDSNKITGNWLNEIISSVIQKEDIKIEELAFNKEMAGIKLKPLLHEKLASFGLSIVNFKLGELKGDIALTKILKAEEKTEKTLSSEFKEFSQNSGREFIFEKVASEGDGDRTINVDLISSGKVKHTQTFLNVDTDDGCSESIMFGSKVGNNKNYALNNNDINAGYKNLQKDSFYKENSDIGFKTESDIVRETRTIILNDTMGLNANEAFCTHCGANFRENDAFCGKCGSKRG